MFLFTFSSISARIVNKKDELLKSKQTRHVNKPWLFRDALIWYSYKLCYNFQKCNIIEKSPELDFYTGLKPESADVPVDDHQGTGKNVVMRAFLNGG